MSIRQIEPDEDVRSFEPQDLLISGNKPSRMFSRVNVDDDDDILVDFESAMSEWVGELQDRQREEQFITQIKEDHTGRGLVTVDRTTGEVVATADDSVELTSQLLELDIEADRYITVRCYE